MMELEIKAKNYTPQSITHDYSLMKEKYEIIDKGGKLMIADYDKAEEIIKLLLKNGKNIDTVSMGLDGDWSWNSEVIWREGIFYEYKECNYSLWAEPIILIHYKDGTNEAYPCWKNELKAL